MRDGALNFIYRFFSRKDAKYAKEFWQKQIYVLYFKQFVFSGWSGDSKIFAQRRKVRKGFTTIDLTKKASLLRSLLVRLNENLQQSDNTIRKDSHRNNRNGYKDQ
jgi:hypothetical protein